MINRLRRLGALLLLAGTLGLASSGARAACSQEYPCGQVTTFEGTITPPASTSTALDATSITNGYTVMATNSAAVSTSLPAAWGKLVVSNVGPNGGYFCKFGGAAGAATGCEYLAAGASDTVWLNGQTAPPTFYSVGTTFYFRN